MHIKDYATAQGWFRKHAAAPSSKGAWKAFVARNKKAQEPRNMKLAKYIPRHEMDNMNTKDLEQSPDSFLRPGETLEDWDTTFRRPNAHGGRIGLDDGGFLDKALADYNTYLDMRKGRRKKFKVIPFKTFFELYSKENRAEGGRIGYDDGQLVQNTVDGSRPGYAGTGAAPLESKGISLNKDQLSLLKEKLTPQEFRKLKFGQARKGDAYDLGVFQRYRVTDAAVKSGSKKAGQKNRLFYKVTELLFPGKLTNASKILNNEKWTNKVIELTKAGKSSDDITEILKVYDNKITRNHTSSTINALVKQNKLSDTYTVLGSSGYTKGEMAGVNKIIEKEVAKGELGRADIGKKAEIADSYVEKWIRANKGDKFYETNYTYEKGLLKKGNLQQQKDLFKWVENTDNISAKAIAKKIWN